MIVNDKPPNSSPPLDVARFLEVVDGLLAVPHH